MSGTTVDTTTETVAPSETVAPNGEQQGSTPAPVETTVPGQEEEPKGDEPSRQSRREARAFANLRRQNSELLRELGRREGREEAARVSGPDGAEPSGKDTPTEVERLRAEMAQRETERVSRSFWSSAAKEAKEKGIEGFADAQDAMRAGEVPTTPAMSHYVTDVADNKAALVVWLADNPDEAERIASLPPVLVGAELAKADACLGKASPRTTRAPAPVRTVGASAAAQSGPPKDMDDFAEWLRKRS